jgi:4-carboxymuconolactone decarboxylase
MSPSERARKNHEELFPSHVSTLAETDPELIEAFDNFAFDEVLRKSKLDIRTRLMVQLASMIACQAVGEYRVMLGAALNVGVTPIQAKEILYQSVPYVGMAKVFDFLRVTNDVLKERGIELPLPPQSTTTPENRAEKGMSVQKGIIGSEVVEKLYAIHRKTRCTFSTFSRRTVSVITTRGLESIYPLASCSRSVCWFHLADAIHR